MVRERYLPTGRTAIVAVTHLLTILTNVSAADHAVDLPIVGRVPHKTERIDWRFDLHAIGLVAAGSGTFRVDDGPAQRVGPGTVFHVYPGPRFRYGPDAGTTWDEYHIGATGAGLARWRAMGWLAEDATAHRVSRVSDLLAASDALLSERRDDRRLNLAERVLVEAKAAREGAGVGGEDDEIGRVLADLRRGLDGPIDFEALAEAHAMSYSKLRQGVKRATGLGPAAYLTRLRIDEAKRRLADPDVNVGEVGRLVGMPDPAVFSRTFKRHAGVGPLAHRRRLSAFRGDPRTSPDRA